MRRELTVAAGLIVVVFALYAPVRSFSFILYDDPAYVTENPHVTFGLTLANLKWAFTTGHAANWHPLTWVSHQLDVSVFGLRPGAHHLMNVAIHALNAVLILVLLHRLTDQFWRAVVVASLFALHPMRVESVAWIAERKDLLCAFFTLLTIAAYARYVRLATPRRYVLVALCMILALLSKPMAVTLPFVLLLLDYWPLGRFQYDGRKALRPLLLEKLPLLTLSIAASIATFYVQRSAGAVRDMTHFSLAERLGNAIVAYARYIGHSLWPVDLLILYPHPGAWPIGVIAFSAVLVALISFVAIRTASKRPYILVGWCWFLGMLVPTLGIVQVGEQSMADRYSYLPSVGLTVAIVWGLGEVISNAAPKRRMAVVLVASILVLLCLATRRQLKIWRGGSISLFEHTLGHSQRNWMAHWQLGTEYAARHDFLRANEQFRDGIALNPDHAGLRYNLANLLRRSGSTPQAIREYRRVVALDPDFAAAWTNLGAALAEDGQWPQAVECFSQAVRLTPQSTDARRNLARAQVHLQSWRATSNPATSTIPP